MLVEQTIALVVFGRGKNFDSSSDTIVRSHMLRLRQKLEQYFRDEGAHEELRISIPRGRYVPCFPPADAPQEIPVPTQPDEAMLGTGKVSVARQGRFGSSWMADALLTALLIAGATAFFSARMLAGWNGTGSPATHQLWSKMFPKNSTTLLVAADSGLVLLHGATGTNTTLQEYVSRDFGRAAQQAQGMQPSTALDLASRRYTSFVDLELFNRITHLPEALAGSYSIRFARDLSINELKSSNVILSGSVDANPWIEAFEPEMNFLLKDDLHHGMRSFINRHPKAGESPIYLCSKAEYGVLAFLPNPSGTGSVFIIEGTSVAGTESVSDFLFAGSLLEPFLKSIREPDGSLPHFEALLTTESLNGSAMPSRLLAWRAYDR